MNFIFEISRVDCIYFPNFRFLKRLNMKMLVQILVVVISLGLSNCGKVSCRSDLPTKCRCYKLSPKKSFVDCHKANIKSEEACEICRIFPNVFRLDLSSNNLTTIPELCFTECHKVGILSLASNNISRLHKNTFSNMLKLNSLYLENNFLLRKGNITSPEAFESLINLRYLNLKRNVKFVNETTTYTYLQNIGNTTMPWLSQLCLDGLPYGSFGGNFVNFKNLTSIDFSGNNGFCKIMGLTKQTFVNVQHVKYLNLSNCRISTIEADAFGDLSHLVHLNLSYNMELGFVTLRNVSYGLQNTQIEVLDYSKVYKTFGTTNLLRRCDIWYLNNTRLKELRLNSNRMSGIEVDGLHLFPRSLEVFWAEDNDWAYGPYILQSGCISNLTRIEISGKEHVHELEYYNNELDIKEKENIAFDPKGCEVPKNISRPHCIFLEGKKLTPAVLKVPPTLKSVRMRRSNLYFKLPSYKQDISFSNNIESVDFSSNILYQWGGKFIKVNKLKHADLANNFCSNVTPEFFENCPNLITLDVSVNKLGQVLAKDIDGLIFKPLQQLQKLTLSNNVIEHLPRKIFTYLHKLKSLDLSYNRIHEIDFAFDHMTHLSELNLQQNKISSVPVTLLDQMDKYSKQKFINVSINLSKNILDMSCENLKFLVWMSDHTRYFKNISTYQFSWKDNTRVPYSKFFSTVAELQKNCRSYTPVIIVSVVSLTTFIAVVIGGLVYRFRWRIRYFYYMAKAKYTGYIPLHNSDNEETFKFDAFISYADDESGFVRDELVENLEAEDELSVCIHERDFTVFIPGHNIRDNIINAIRNSRTTIVVLSKNFLQSKWCRYEFNMARMEGIYSRSRENFVFVIMYKEVDMSHLSPEMRDCLESESFLKYPSLESEVPYFWQTLKQALIRRRN